MLDEAGLHAVGIFASSGLDEDTIARLLDAGAPITGFGVGSEMGVSADAPMLDIAYKLVAYDGRGRIKLSAGKTLLPGRKQVFRVESNGMASGDEIVRHDEVANGRPLLRKVMERGVRLPAGRVSLDNARAHRQAELDRLPARLRSLSPADQAYPVKISARLMEDAERLRRRYQPMAQVSTQRTSH